MKYKSALEVLPAELTDEIQDYIQENISIFHAERRKTG